MGGTLNVEVARQDFLYDCHGPALRDARWESLDPRIASVDASGLVRGRMVGQTSVRARFERGEARAAITVVPTVKRIVVLPADTTLSVGDTVRFTAVAYGEDDQPLPTVRLTFLVISDSISRKKDLPDPLRKIWPVGARPELNSVRLLGWRNGAGHVVAYLAGRADSVRVRAVRPGPTTQ